ncbi:MAG TPA: hypothetical protein VLC09_06355 [Polyangiaceae bacterium]|nr:hypothetical protein [Polyangiaceae bacterium]
MVALLMPLRAEAQELASLSTRELAAQRRALRYEEYWILTGFGAMAVLVGSGMVASEYMGENPFYLCFSNCSPPPVDPADYTAGHIVLVAGGLTTLVGLTLAIPETRLRGELNRELRARETAQGVRPVIGLSSAGASLTLSGTF